MIDGRSHRYQARGLGTVPVRSHGINGEPPWSVHALECSRALMTVQKMTENGRKRQKTASHVFVVVDISLLLLRLNFSHYELPITYIREFLVELLNCRS